MTLHTAWTHLMSGQPHAARTLLETLRDHPDHTPSSEWWRLYGLALHASGDRPAGYAAIATAIERATDPTLKARALIDQGSLLLNDRRFEDGQYGLLEALPLLHGAPKDAALLTYNIGWAYVTRDALDLAAHRFEDGVRLARRSSDARRHLTLLRIGLSVHARLTGDYDAAAKQARLAIKAASIPAQEAIAWRSLAQALWRAGDQRGAEQALDTSMGLLPDGRTRHNNEANLAMLRAHRDGDATDLEAYRARVMPLERVRLDLHLAEHARRESCPEDALTLLRQAIHADEPYPLRDEAPLLPELFTLGRAHGLPLPETRAPLVRSVHLLTLGEPGLVVNGRRLTYAVSATDLAVPAYLLDHGPTSWTTVAAAVTETGDVTAVERAAAQLRSWIGDERALYASSGRLHLSPYWTWTGDYRDAAPSGGTFLPESYAPWVLEVRDRLEGDVLRPCFMTRL